MKLHQVHEQLDARDANLAGSRFVDVNLQQAIFNDVNLQGTRFSDVNLTRVSIEDANLSHMTIEGVPVAELFAAWRSRAGALLFVKDLDALGSFYQAVLGVAARRESDDQIELIAPRMRLLLHRLPEHVAVSVPIANPPNVRSQAAVKLLFEVPSIARARELASQHGGQLFPPEREWLNGDRRVCDGIDPEGNVVQFVEATSGYNGDPLTGPRFAIPRAE